MKISTATQISSEFSALLVSLFSPWRVEEGMVGGGKETGTEGEEGVEERKGC